VVSRVQHDAQGGHFDPQLHFRLAPAGHLEAELEARAFEVRAVAISEQYPWIAGRGAEETRESRVARCATEACLHCVRNRSTPSAPTSRKLPLRSSVTGPPRSMLVAALPQCRGR